jgi:hypothetical protein
MAGKPSKQEQRLRDQIEAEREQLAHAAEHLRAELDVGKKLRAKLPVVAAGALGAGFFIAGGIGATMRLLARRGREGREKARLGRFKIVDRD